MIKRQSSGLNRENDTAALFDETLSLSLSLFSFRGMETVSFHGSMCRSPFDGDLAETYLNDAVFFAASLAFPPIDASGRGQIDVPREFRRRKTFLPSPTGKL